MKKDTSKEQKNTIGVFLRFLIILCFVVLMFYSFVKQKAFYSLCVSFIYSVFGIFDPYILPKLIYSIFIIGNITSIYLAIKKNFLIVSFISFFMFLIILIAMLKKIPLNCGCFGEIKTFPNLIYQALFYLFIIISNTVLHLKS